VRRGALVNSPDPVCQPPEFGPWHPGILSQIPHALRPLTTLFRAQHSYTSHAQAEELHGLTGIPITELARLRPERLALHELLVRITADLSISDGPRVEDLGIVYRQMADRLLARDLIPRMSTIVATYESARSDLGRGAQALLTDALTRKESGGDNGSAKLGRWLTRRPSDTRSRSDEDHARALLVRLQAAARAGGDPILLSAASALLRVTSALMARHGRLWAPPPLIVEIAVDLASNDHGARAIGQLIAPWVRDGARREQYALLPPQPRPIVMNIKGSSASGKSSMRPLQRDLAERLGVRWSDFALISPDIWRKQLLDYGTLGEAYKYAGAFTSEEVQIVDRKLDRHMADKAMRGGMPHMLIDRFRFDSFAPMSDEAGSNLLTRFGEDIHLFFMITPPAATVERSWHRGLEVGRYKAVDDLLAHNVEAYAGMPELFFTWALNTRKRVRHEFLDNSVAPGQRPRTVAFGLGASLYVMDVGCMLDVERYRRLDTTATCPEALFPNPADVAPERNTGFLVACVRRLAQVQFCDRDSGRIYLSLRNGEPVWRDDALLARKLADPHTRAGIQAVVAEADTTTIATSAGPVMLADALGEDATHILGAWRPADSSGLR